MAPLGRHRIGERFGRVVLVVDLWHPSLSEEDKAVLDAPIFQRFGKAAA